MPEIYNSALFASAPSSLPTVSKLRPVGEMDATRNTTLYYITVTTTIHGPRQDARTLQLGRLYDMMQRIAAPAQKQKTWKTTHHIPTLPVMISYGNHVVHAYAMLDCASKLTLLKSSIVPQLKPDLSFVDSIQLYQSLALSDTASAKLTFAIGSYKHR